MLNTLKIVTAIPLDSIWSEEREFSHKRESYLTKEQLRDLLKQRPVEFVVANVGDKLQWTDINKCFDFWRNEVEGHVVIDLNRVDLDNYPGNYAYIASKWSGENELPVILLEKVH